MSLRDTAEKILDGLRDIPVIDTHEHLLPARVSLFDAIYFFSI